jgi:hypothetical protein
MKVRYDESFLFPSSQVDFNRGAINFPQGQLRGLPGPIGALDKLNYADYLLETVRTGLVIGLIQTYQNDLYKESLKTNNSSLRFQAGDCGDIYNTLTSALQHINAGNKNAAMDMVNFAISQAEGGTCPNVRNIFDRAIQQTAAEEQAAADALTAAQQSAIQQANAQAAAQQAAAQQAAAQSAAQQAAAEQAAQQVAAEQAAQLVAVNARQAAANQAAAQQAAAQQAAAAATSKATTATNTSTVGYDLAVSLLKAAGKYTAGMTEQQMATALTALEGNPVFVMTPSATATAIAATKTQTTATNTATGTVQTTDKVSGTTSTVNAATGAVTVTTATGQTASGTGTVAAGGVITTVDPKAGVVTTQNTQTGVVTQTDAATGKTVTATQITGSAGGGGTFMLPDQKTVSTTTAITSTGGLDSGKIALFGLIGLLLLRGAVK